MANCGDYVVTPNGSGRVIAIQSDHKGNVLVYPNWPERTGWFVELEKNATVIPEPEDFTIKTEYFTRVRYWLDLL
jgi:hypothetical protein